LQISENSHRTPDTGGNFADQLCPGDMILALAVGEIQANDIDAGADHAFQHLGIG
jgi:hypothetical protein